MTRAVIYARFSSDKQDDRSIDDQIAMCRDYASRQGWTIVEVYSDHAVSGASVHGRFAFERMVAAARLRGFDAILTEDLDRLSRNQADIARLFERAEFADVAIATVADGAINEMHIGLKGTMSALFLRTLALKTHRGLQGRVRAGKSAGGRSYGYRVTEIGERAIDEAEAGIIRRIFTETARGDSPRAIASRLNAEGIPSPRGGQWNASTIHGHKARGTGILRNPLYAGEMVWNRQRFVRDPDTGKRVSRPNGAADIMRAAVPALRIVGEREWAEAQATIESSRQVQLRGPRQRHLLSGLLRCGSCGGSFVVSGGKPGKVRFACSTHREKGTCTNRRLVQGELIEDRILGAIERELLHEDVVAAAVAAYIERRRQNAVAQTVNRSKIERRLGEVKRALDRQVEEISAGRGGRSVHEKIVALEAEEDELRAKLASVPDESVVRLHPGAVERVRGMVRDLRSMIGANVSPEARAKGIAAVRGIVESVRIYPRDDAEGRDLILTGQLAALLQPEKLKKGERGMGNVVAGTGFQQLHTSARIELPVSLSA